MGMWARAREVVCAMHVAVTGSSGLVGSALLALLSKERHAITRLVRSDPRPGEVRWDPVSSTFDAEELQEVDAVVHLAGENISGRRWSSAFKEKIRSSRVKGTDLLSRGLANSQSPPKVLVCASAIGFYGNRGDEVMDEAAGQGSGYLADVVGQWEAATRPASDAGIRVVHLRIGVVLSRDGGALQKMLTPFKLGLGGRIGSGAQYVSWISIDDVARAVVHALKTDSISGPVNATSPQPVTNSEFTRALGRVLHRPTFFPVPAIAARLAFGQMADDLLLSSTKVTSERLLASGFEFQHPSLEDCLNCLLDRNS